MTTKNDTTEPDHKIQDMEDECAKATFVGIANFILAVALSATALEQLHVDVSLRLLIGLPLSLCIAVAAGLYKPFRDGVCHLGLQIAMSL